MNDAKRASGLRNAAAVLKELLEPGLLGNFKWFDAIEVTTFEQTRRPDKPPSRNVFSIFVAGTGDPPPAPDTPFLCRPYTLKGLESRRFGLTRQPLKVDDLLAALDRYASSGVWQPFSAGPLQVGKLTAAPHYFCPADTRTEVPLNAVLKNNFWAGSYVVELKDDVKADLKELVDNDTMFHELSAWLETMLPLNIARVPDRIGNVIFQVPSQAIIADYHRRPEQPIELTLAWQPGITPRPVAGEYRVEQEGMVVSLARFDFPVGRAHLNVPMTGGDIRFSVWDEQKQVLLATSAVLNASDGRFSVETSMSTGIEQPRRFLVQEPGNVATWHTVALMEPSAGWRAHRQPRRPQETDWRARRELQASMKRLVDSKSFVQYGLGGAQPEDEQLRALKDIRELIKHASQGAIYLWDPYLAANDILSTLAFCSDAGTELRGLTSWDPKIMSTPAAPAPAAPAAGAALLPATPATATSPAAPAPVQAIPQQTAREAWIAKQKAALDAGFIGDANFKLEYRMSWGVRGSFHDRFLMFPGLGRTRTRVWSLGSSINHIGSQHCIVQEVAYPEPVLEAFLAFWDNCDKAEHLIWKYL